jgi:molybdopterin molybdotransferase
MITVAEAKKIIATQAQALPLVNLPLSESAGMRLAEHVFSPIDMPPFNQSAVDGYAFAFDSWQATQPLRIHGELPAGAEPLQQLAPGTAIRIFTGAAVPAGADTVVMQEKTTAQNGMLHINDTQLTAGANVRLQGADIQKGTLALPVGTVLQPAAIGFLAGLGITAVPVQQKPVVHIIVTGNELQQPGLPLHGAQVYESNSYMLTAALQQVGLQATITYCDDNPDNLREKMHIALQQADVLLLTGGVSVGDYDFVPTAAAACGVQQLFHKIQQRPGKPFYFGKKENKLVFGLPGNPSSVLTCFYEYVLHALHLLNNSIQTLVVKQAMLAQDMQKNTGLTHFLKANYDGTIVNALGAQESYRLSSFALSNCLLVLPEIDNTFKKGQEVEVHLLPY